MRLASAAMVAALVIATGYVTSGAHPAAEVTLARVPHGGIQPEIAVDSRGVVHLLYFAGAEAHAGNLFYVRSADHGSSFSAPVRVNSQDASAIATGTIRGGQIAVGGGGRVHVAWNGSDKAEPRGLINPATDKPSAPFLYARSNADGTAFEPQRNLTHNSFGIDGGGSIAADDRGNVYAAWHALPAGGGQGEDHRVVWIARSTDAGATFAEESPAWHEPTGACGCCGMRLFARSADSLLLLYRSATAVTHRDIFLLESNDNGRSFRGSKVQPWEIRACPMSSMSIAASGPRLLGAWETAGQVYFGEVDTSAAAIRTPIAPPGTGGTRKHPRVVIGARGEMLFLWTEDTAWARGGSLAWQIYDASGKPTDSKGRTPGVPVWSFGAGLARPDGGFTILY